MSMRHGSKKAGHRGPAYDASLFRSSQEPELARYYRRLGKHPDYPFGWLDGELEAFYGRFGGRKAPPKW